MPETGCVHEMVQGTEALLCRIELCERRRLRLRLDQLAIRIRGAIDTGGTPRARQLKRVKKLLRRCGVLVEEV